MVCAAPASNTITHSLVRVNPYLYKVSVHCHPQPPLVVTLWTWLPEATDHLDGKPEGLVMQEKKKGAL